MFVKFEIYFDGDFWCARCLEEDIFTQGKTVDEVFKNMKEAVEVHFEDREKSLYGITFQRKSYFC